MAGFSPQPAPSGEPPRSQGAQPSAPEQRGTDQTPLTVKVLPGPDAEQKAKNEEHERQEKAAIDRKIGFETQRIADYTFWLAAFTLALFCIAIGQAGLFWWQLGYMRDGLRDAKIAAEAAMLNTRAAIGIELPRIQVQPNNLGFGDLSDASGVQHQCSVSGVRLTNGGRTSAFPVEIHGGMSLGTLPDEPVYSTTETFRPDLIFEPGEMSWRKAFADCSLSISQEQRDLLMQGQIGLWFYCSFVYRDFMDTRRELGFCWRWTNVGLGMGWRPDNTPAYNSKRESYRLAQSS